MNNMQLEDILSELCRYGLPSLHPFNARPKDWDPRLPAPVGLWDCHIQVPYNPASYRLNPNRTRNPGLPEPGTREYERKHMAQIGLRGKGATAREAAQQCLDRVLMYVEHGWHYHWPEELRPKDIPVYESV